MSEPEGAMLHPCGQPGEATLLADKLRPRILDEFVGQTHLTARNTLLFSADGKLTTENIIFWGPPG